MAGQCRIHKPVEWQCRRLREVDCPTNSSGEESDDALPGPDQREEPNLNPQDRVANTRKRKNTKKVGRVFHSLSKSETNPSDRQPRDRSKGTATAHPSG